MIGARLYALPAGLRWQRMLPPLLMASLALCYLAGALKVPPWGGLLAIGAVLFLAAAFRLMLRRVGLFLAWFLLFATFAPFLSRFVGVPLGWFKGTFFLLAAPVWFLSRASSGKTSDLAGAVRVPLLCFLGAAVIFTILGVVTVFRGVDKLIVLDTLRGYLLYPTLMFLAAEAAGSRRQIHRFFRWILALCTIAAAGAVAQAMVGIDVMKRLGLSLETWGVAYVAIDPLSGKFFQRVFSILDDQMALASFCLLGITLGLYFLETDRGRRRLLLLLGLALNAYALILTYNVTVIMGTVLFFLISIWRRRSPRLLAAFFLTLAVVVGLAWIRFGPFIRNRVISSFSVEAGVTNSLVSRVEESQRAIKLFQESPVIGYGLGSTANRVVYYKAGLAEKIGEGIATDNFYMTTALDGGLIGLGAMLLLHLIPLWGLIRLGRSRLAENRRLSRIGSTYVFVLLLMNLSNAPMITNPTNLVYWMLAGLVWKLVNDERTQAVAPGGGSAREGVPWGGGRRLPSGARAGLTA